MTNDRNQDPAEVVREITTTHGIYQAISGMAALLAKP